MNNNIDFRKASRILKNNGFAPGRIKSSHHHFYKNGVDIVVPYKVNRMLWNRIVKEYNLVC